MNSSANVFTKEDKMCRTPNRHRGDENCPY